MGDRTKDADRDGSWIDRELYPFKDRYADVRGCRVHYLDEGEGPVLLMLHGNPTWSFLYREIVVRLRPHFRCIAPDYPGFGLSTAPAGYGFTPPEHAAVIEDLVTALDLTGIGLVVHDWGGPIGLAAAARHPERYERLIVGNSFAWPVSDAWKFRAFSSLFAGKKGEWAIRRHNAFVEWVMPRAVTRPLTKTEMDHYRRPFADPASRTPTLVFPRAIVESRDFLAEVERGLEKLKDLPTLVAWGTKDPAFGEGERRRFESLFPNHKRATLRGAGHYIQEDAPGRIVDAIREWTEKIG